MGSLIEPAERRHVAPGLLNPGGDEGAVNQLLAVRFTRRLVTGLNTRLCLSRVCTLSSCQLSKDRRVRCCTDNHASFSEKKTLPKGVREKFRSMPTYSAQRPHRSPLCLTLEWRIMCEHFACCLPATPPRSLSQKANATCLLKKPICEHAQVYNFQHDTFKLTVGGQAKPQP